jgi:hypothetical protein
MGASIGFQRSWRDMWFGVRQRRKNYLVLSGHLCFYTSLKSESLISNLTIERHIRWDVWWEG